MDDTQHQAASVVRGACPHDCPDTCAWQVTVKDGIAVKLVGDPDHPFTQGGLCAKVNHYLERVYSPDRILFPLRRVGPKGVGTFERVSWDEALDDITARLRTIIETNGPMAVLPYSYLGTQGLITLPKEWRPLADGSFPTPSGKCEFYSAALAARGLDPLPSYIPAWESPMGDPQLSARYPLSLLTSKSALHFLNSSYANLRRHLKAEREPLLEMHPDDAAHRGIVDCDLVRIYNDRGSVKAHVRIGDRVRPGVVSLPSGWWASLSPGGSSANTLTADGLSDWGGGGDFHDTLVEVARPG